MGNRVKHGTVHQIIGKDGKPLKSHATSTTWVGYGYGQEFAPHTVGNKVKAYTTGEDYFKDFIEAVENAQEEICIAGWQVSWDAILDRKKTRLFDVLLAAAKAKEDIKIYVLAWDDQAPIQTYDDQTKAVLETINEIIGGRPTVEVRLAASQPDECGKFFSHHQKHVVIDRKIAFVGGMDLCYGRFDDATYNLKANADGREALNRYNPCIPWTGMSQDEQDAVVDPRLLSGLVDQAGDFKWLGTKSSKTKVVEKIMAGAWQANMPDSATNPDANLNIVKTTLNPETQPRMPWQDVHCKIEGPAVADLARNFVLRWNLLDAKKPKLPLPNRPDAYPKMGSCEVQVLRSAPLSLRLAEYNALSATDKALFPKPERAQDDIAQAMYTLIDKAERFIYIENQFFVSAFGGVDVIPATPSGPASQVKGYGLDQKVTRSMCGSNSHEPPRNRLCAHLGDKIDRRIMAGKDFHVIIVLPVHPEGALNDGAIMSQIHWTMQSLVFGKQSLLNRVRRSIKARELHKKHQDYQQVYDENNTEYKEVPLEACEKYVTLLNLRNWAQLGGRYVTEQIYVHSKTMVVDDMYALIGSANINDRSLLGSHDSELAVLVVDTDVSLENVRGNGKKLPVRTFAKKLRRDLWGKLFGITGNVRPATGLKAVLDKPADPKTWKKVQEVAKHNTALYEAAFEFIPRNDDTEDSDKPKKDRRPASIWPRWHPFVEPNTQKILKYTSSGLMPFEDGFWSDIQHTAAAGLVEIKGFITSLPIGWTKNENDNLEYHNQLLVENEPTSNGNGVSADIALGETKTKERTS